jgi:3-hydroxyisobutyrate dehydrogenase-like beta-hydroxyacid dehydrogenase
MYAITYWEIHNRSTMGAATGGAKGDEMAKVGFIGLGIMGAPMAANVLRKGNSLTVFDVDAGAMDRLAAQGADKAASPAEVAAASEVVITMLPDGPDVERVALGPGGIVEGARPGMVLIDMSSSQPDITRKIGATLAARGCAMVDSPVGKTADHAVTGTLTLMVGGDPAVVSKVRPILDCMGTDFFDCGALGNGHAMKATNNLLATALVAINAEVLAAGIRAGLTLETMFSVMQKTMAWNSQLAVAFPLRPLKGDFAPGFMLKLAHKDCRNALRMIDAMGLDAPVGKATLAACQTGIDQGYGSNDVGVLVKMREDKAGIKVRFAK